MPSRCMSTLDSLTDILVRDYGVAREKVTSDATLAILKIDSLSLLELMFKIEDRYGVKITEDSRRGQLEVILNNLATDIRSQ